MGRVKNVVYLCRGSVFGVCRGLLSRVLLQRPRKAIFLMSHKLINNEML